MKLHFYFARRFLWSFLLLFGVFFLLQALIDLLEQVRRLGDTSASFSDVIELTLLHAPRGVYRIIPLVMILATVALFISLARSSELVVVRAAGRSALRALLAPVAVAIAIGVLVITTINPIVAATSKRYHERYQSFIGDGADVLSISAEGLWLRQGGAEGQTVIRATSASPEATILYDVTFISYSPSGGPLKRIEARQAKLSDGAWHLTGAKTWPLAQGINPEANATEHATLTVPSTLTGDRIRDTMGTPEALSVWDLPQMISQLKQAGFSPRRHEVWFQMELARPLFFVAMVLIGSAFTMRHARGGGTGVAVLITLMLGFGLYYIRNFAQILGENGQIPIWIAAWAPPVASVMLATGIILNAEDG